MRGWSCGWRWCLLGTGIAGLFGKLPGCEPAPYIIRFTEDRPNPLYRRICYTIAWGEIVAFAVLNVAGLIGAVVTGRGISRSSTTRPTFRWPAACGCWAPSASCRGSSLRPRAKAMSAATFTGSWMVTIAQPVLLVLWKVLPHGFAFDVIKLVAFSGTLAIVGWWARLGLLPRTRPIVPGELAVSD